MGSTDPVTEVADAPTSPPDPDGATLTRRSQNVRPDPGLLDHLAALRAMPRGLLLGRIAYRLRRPLLALPFSVRLLPGCRAAQPLTLPPDPWPGDAAQGAALVEGRFRFSGQTILNPHSVWRTPEAGKDWLTELHGFAWLRDLRACNGDAARRLARTLTAEWIEAYGSRWSEPAWDPLVIGRRLSHWMGQYDFFASSGEIEFRQAMLDSAARQAANLARVLPAGLSGADLILALRGLAIAGACLPGGERWLSRAMELLTQELPQQILADGGHCERSPTRHLGVLRDLVDIKSMLHAAGRELPTELQVAIESMGPTLRLFQHGDGGLTLFNGSQAEEGFKVDMVLRRANARRKPRLSAPQSGFQRIQAGRSLVIVDAGVPAPPGLDRCAHAGTLSMEFSVGRERLVVNCGAPGPGTAGASWQQAVRATAAHSTLTLAETNSAALATRRRFLGPSLLHRPEIVQCRREEVEGSTLLEMLHDGYRLPYGAIYHRRLYLSAEGDDLRGEDKVEIRDPAQGAAGLPYTIRFHLHPGVKASFLSGGGVLLRLPKGGGWRLRAAGAEELTLEESIYFGEGDPRRTTQLVLRGTLDKEGAQVKWAFRREAPNASSRGAAGDTSAS